MRRVLLVEDEANSIHAIAEYLEACGFGVRVARDGAEAMRAAEEFAPDALLCDWLLGGSVDGHTVVRELVCRIPGLAVVLISGLPAGAVRADSRDLPVRAFVAKPSTLAEIGRALEAALATPASPSRSAHPQR